MELDHPNFDFKPSFDERRRMEEPIPVLLEAVADMHLPCSRVAREKLVSLYVGILEFVEVQDPHHLVLAADNFRLLFDLPRRELLQEDFRPIKIIVPSLRETQKRLIDAKLEYERQKGVVAGTELLVLQDADGNWLEIREHREML